MSTVNAIGPHLPYEQTSLDFLLNRGGIFGDICKPHPIRLQPNHDLLFKPRWRPCMVTPGSVPNCSDATCNTRQHRRSKPLSSQSNSDFWCDVPSTRRPTAHLSACAICRRSLNQTDRATRSRAPTQGDGEQTLTISLTTHTDSTITPAKQDSSNRLGES